MSDEFFGFLGVSVILCVARKNGLSALPFWGIQCVCLLMAFDAAADQFDAINYSATTGVNYDSNIYRLPSNASPLLVVGKSSTGDVIRILSAAANFSKDYSNQKVQMGASVTNNKFNNLSSLDYNSTSYRGALNWTLTSKLSGTLSDERLQTLNSFADIRTNVRNLKSENVRKLNADWWVQSDWHVLMGVASNISSNSLTTINSLNYRTSTAEWGLKYTPSEKSSVSVKTKNIQGNYINVATNFATLLDTGYTERQDVIEVLWQPTSKSGFVGSWMNLQRRHPLFYQRDYGGGQGGLTYNLGVSDITHVTMSFNRSLNTWFDTFSSYYVNDTISISPKWELAPKLALHTTLARNTSSYRGSVIANAVTRQDVQKQFELGLTWSPQRSITLNASLQHSARNSNFTFYEFSDNAAGVSVSGTY
jgi:exopolysaccharide biosynthesis operon protein EpsL